MIFEDDEDRRAFLRLLMQVLVRFELACHAYCLMGTHYHLVVDGERCRLSKAMHRLNGLYARQFNERRGRRGHLFEERFVAWVIRDESHLEQTCRYVAANPVRAGLCGSVDAWPWTWLAVS